MVQIVKKVSQIDGSGAVGVRPSAAELILFLKSCLPPIDLIHFMVPLRLNRKVPKVLKVPKVPKVLKVPKVPQVPRVHKVAKVPKVPEVPKVPQVLKVPKVPT